MLLGEPVLQCGEEMDLMTSGESSLTHQWLEMGAREILISNLLKTDKVKGKAQCVCAEGAAWSDDGLMQQQLTLVFSVFVT